MMAVAEVDSTYAIERAVGDLKILRKWLKVSGILPDEEASSLMLYDLARFDVCERLSLPVLDFSRTLLSSLSEGSAEAPCDGAPSAPHSTPQVGLSSSIAVGLSGAFFRYKETLSKRSFLLAEGFLRDAEKPADDASLPSLAGTPHTHTSIQSLSRNLDEISSEKRSSPPLDVLMEGVRTPTPSSNYKRKFSFIVDDEGGSTKRLKKLEKMPPKYIPCAKNICISGVLGEEPNTHSQKILSSLVRVCEYWAFLSCLWMLLKADDEGLFQRIPVEICDRLKGLSMMIVNKFNSSSLKPSADYDSFEDFQYRQHELAFSHKGKKLAVSQVQEDDLLLLAEEHLHDLFAGVDDRNNPESFLNVLKEDNIALCTESSEKSLIINSLEVKAQSLKEELYEKEAKRIQLENRAYDMENSMRQTEANLSKSNADLKSAEAKASRLESENNRLRKLVEESLGKGEMHRSFKEKLLLVRSKDKEIDELREKNERLKELLMSNNDLKITVKTQSVELETLQGKYDEVLEEVQQLQYKNEKITEIRKMLSETMVENTCLQQEITSSKADLENYKNIFENREKLLVEYEEQISEAKRLKSSSGVLSDAVEPSESSFEAKASLQEDLDFFTTSANTANKENEALKQKLQMFDGKRFEDLNFELENSKRYNEELSQTISSLNKTLQLSKKEACEMKLKADDLDEQLSSSKLRNQKLKDEIEDLKIYFEKQMVHKELLHKKLQERFEELSEDHEAKQAALIEAKKTVANLFLIESELKRDKEKLKDELAAEIVGAQSLRQEIDADWKQKVKMLEEKNSTLVLEAKLELGRKNADLVASQEKETLLGPLNEEISKLKEKIRLLHQEIDNLENDLKNERSKGFEKQRLLGDSNSMIERTKAESLRIKNSLAAVSEEAKSAKEVCIDLKDKLRNSEKALEQEKKTSKQLKAQSKALETQLQTLMDDSLVSPDSLALEQLQHSLKIAASMAKDLERELEAAIREKKELQDVIDGKAASTEKSHDEEVLRIELGKCLRELTKLRKALREKDWAVVEAEKEKFFYKQKIRELHQENIRILLSQSKGYAEAVREAEAKPLPEAEAKAAPASVSVAKESQGELTVARKRGPSEGGDAQEEVMMTRSKTRRISKDLLTLQEEAINQVKSNEQSFSTLETDESLRIIESLGKSPHQEAEKNTMALPRISASTNPLNDLVKGGKSHASPCSTVKLQGIPSYSEEKSDKLSKERVSSELKESKDGVCASKHTLKIPSHSKSAGYTVEHTSKHNLSAECVKEMSGSELRHTGGAVETGGGEVTVTPPQTTLSSREGKTPLKSTAAPTSSNPPTISSPINPPASPTSSSPSTTPSSSLPTSPLKPPAKPASKHPPPPPIVGGVKCIPKPSVKSLSKLAPQIPPSASLNSLLVAPTSNTQTKPSVSALKQSTHTPAHNEKESKPLENSRMKGVMNKAKDGLHHAATSLEENPTKVCVKEGKCMLPSSTVAEASNTPSSSSSSSAQQISFNSLLPLEKGNLRIQGQQACVLERSAEKPEEEASDPLDNPRGLKSISAPPSSLRGKATPAPHTAASLSYPGFSLLAHPPEDDVAVNHTHTHCEDALKSDDLGSSPSDLNSPLKAATNEGEASLWKPQSELIQQRGLASNPINRVKLVGVAHRQVEGVYDQAATSAVQNQEGDRTHAAEGGRIQAEGNRTRTAEGARAHHTTTKPANPRKTPPHQTSHTQPTPGAHESAVDIIHTPTVPQAHTSAIGAHKHTLTKESLMQSPLRHPPPSARNPDSSQSSPSHVSLRASTLTQPSSLSTIKRENTHSSTDTHETPSITEQSKVYLRRMEGSPLITRTQGSQQIERGVKSAGASPAKPKGKAEGFSAGLAKLDVQPQNTQCRQQ